MTTADVLREARALIEDPANFWRPDHRGKGTRCAAVAMWDAVGETTGNDDSYRAELTFLRAVGLQGGSDPSPHVQRYNDSHGHVEVLAAFDRAIMLAERTA